ncbi:hypothetical protein DNK06_23600 [Pseudomonas daroniae]|uniref:Uncharacterized protein n=1 Tax=Phytopseudomonas daroniae TaxID=2487519 RepID=A0A4Q9QGK6_9GAMM|nr:MULTISPECIES: hypothetical protein [Pseudomonas]TBU71609.1 hypothetical protein DNK06_23600 [Pseudomonas daroniae]TBU75124.1 hypothetical protein DNK31_23170 [Pseudomonas sp. FRB 228]TBU86974.1 hypothetical protein DNJ99_23050 [Pseudomonas daroniae]
MNTQTAPLARSSSVESLDMPLLAIALPLLLVSLALAGSGTAPLALLLSGLGAIAAYALARQALVPTTQPNTVTV